jgi:hypothetical protein
MSIDVDYENPWFFEGVPFLSENINDNFGFVYLITNIQNNRKYIGRKYFWSFRTPKGKKRKVKSESDWKKYYGSCPELKEDIDKLGRDNFSRTILSLHKTGGKTNFEETFILKMFSRLLKIDQWFSTEEPSSSYRGGDLLPKRLL